jgi:hypothetical protein
MGDRLAIGGWVTENRRILGLVFLGLAIVALIILAAGLSDLTFLPGRPLPRFAQPAGGLGDLPALPGSELLGFLLSAFYVLGILLLPVAIVYVIISPEARKRVVRSLGLLLWLVALFLLMRARPEIFQELQLQPLDAPQPGEFGVAPPEFVARFPPWLVVSTALALAALVVAGLVGVGWFVWRRRHPPATPLEQLGQEAQQALDALQAGADIQDTVIRCYLEMSRVLDEHRGLRRAEAATPREFEQQLKEAGLPDAQIEQLTRLFEAVRYGAKVAGEGQQRQAVDCLAGIVQACQRSP